MHKISKEQVQAAHEFSLHNKSALQNSETAGCYQCLAIFPPSEIEEFTDGNDTALCPKCGTDSVLGDSSGYPIVKEVLSQLKKHWFR